MNRFTRYNRILAGVLAAALVVTNLSANAQTVLASETEQQVEQNMTESVVETQDLTEAPAAASEETPAAEVAETPVSESSVETPTTEPPAESIDIPSIEESGSVTETDTTGNTGSDETNTDSTYNKEETSSETGSTETKETTEKSEETKAEEKAEESTETKFEVTKSLDCSQDHEHTADCYVYTDKDGKKWTLTCTEDHEHTKDCYKAAEEKSEEPEIIEESGDTHVVTYETETEGIKVKAEALSEVLPEGATLHASRIEDDDELTTVTEALDESDVTYDDYLALDVHFNDKDGNEIEPVGSVKVSFELAEELLPENYKSDTLSVQHLEGTGDKAETKEAKDINVVTVADTSDNEDTGSIAVVAADSEQNSSADTARNVSAEFEVKSFSTFTISWSNGGTASKNVTVNACDEEGDVLAFSATPTGDKNYSVQLYSGNGLTIDTTNVAADEASANSYTNNSTSSQLKISGYVPVNATLVCGEQKYENVTSIKLSYDWHGQWSYPYYYYYSWTCTITSDGKSVELEGIDDDNVELNIQYRRIKATLSYNLTSYITDRSGSSNVEVTGNGTTPDSQEVYYGSTVVLPELDDKTATYNGTTYHFMGWFEKQYFTVQSGGNMQGTSQIYQPGDKYIVSGDTILYAIWSKEAQNKATFFIRLDGIVPSRTTTASDQADYTGAIATLDSVNNRRWTYDAASEGMIEETEDGKVVRAYVKNKVSDGLEALPTNSQIAAALQIKYNSRNIDYYVDVDKSGNLYVKNVRTGTTSKEGMTVNDVLYVHWYVQKYHNSDGYPFNVDGVLLVKGKVTVHYDANCSGSVSNIPNGYQVAKNTTIVVGSSGQATGNVGENPERDGYKFLGWNTAADGSGTSYRQSDDLPLGEEDINLYAMWGEVDSSNNLKTGNLKISLDVNGGTAPVDQEYTVIVSVPEAMIDGRSSYTATLHKQDGTTEELTLDFVDDNGESAAERLTLKKDEYILIENLPDGASYEVDERNVPTGYRVTYKDANDETITDAKGTIVAAMTREIKIINSKRIVKTGVTADAAPWVALTSLLGASAILYIMYRRFRRNLTR